MLINYINWEYAILALSKFALSKALIAFYSKIFVCGLCVVYCTLEFIFLAVFALLIAY